VKEDKPAAPSVGPNVTDVPVAFVADARLISVLGEQLIGSEKVGILELVKNAYDAGAHVCTVTLEGVPDLPPQSRTAAYQSLPGPVIEIRDDGKGMSRDDLINGWLRPATTRRTRVKEQLRIESAAAEARGSKTQFDALVEELKSAHGGRLPLGEKGIGRLATHRLGQYLWLRTKTADDPNEWQLKIDWSDFDSIGPSPVNLDKVPLTLRHQPPTTDYGVGGSGTVICCYGGRRGYTWSTELISEVGRAINALRSPSRGPRGFEPRFTSPHVAAHDMDSPLEGTSAPFELLALVDQEGKADVEISFQPPTILDGNLEAFKNQESVDLRAPALDKWRSANGTLRKPKCGPFLLHVRSWIRDPKWMGAEFKEIRKVLDRYGGINIYRDGLVTVPAEQSAKVDWLGLQQSQIKKSSNISYYQLSGEIELSQEHNLELRDRSSREGIIETQAYGDLALLTGSLVDMLQFQMKSVRDRWIKAKLTRQPLSTIRAYASAAAEMAKTMAEKYDFKDDPMQIAAKVGGDNPAERLVAASKALGSLGDQLKLQEDEREGLVEAAGFGLAIGVAVHELAKLATAIISDVRRLEDIVGPLFSELKTLRSVQQRAEAMLSEVKRLVPLRVTRSDAARRFSVRSAVEAGRTAFARSLEQGQIVLHVDREDFSVVGRFGAVAQVFANLFDNAIYWIGTEGTGGAIQVAISAKDRTVLVSDTGPGVSEKMSGHLFEPFYSEKSPPSGLGLYICRHYLGALDAGIRLARGSERSQFRGAQFLLDFSRSPSGDQ
jgi:signal transduction histidine kinase